MSVLRTIFSACWTHFLRQGPVVFMPCEGQHQVALVDWINFTHLLIMSCSNDFLVNSAHHIDLNEMSSKTQEL